MKKILTLAVAFVAIASQAASINWNINLSGTRYIKNSSNDRMTGTAYLILTDDLATLENDISADLSTFVTALNSTALASTTLSGGKPSPINGVADSARLTAGTDYTYAFLFLDTANKEYYLSAEKTAAAYDTAIPEFADPNLITYTTTDVKGVSNAAAATATFSSAVKAGGDDPVTPPIPEPATGALALAGVALLFRRKKA